MLKALIQPVTIFEQNACILYCDETNINQFINVDTLPINVKMVFFITNAFNLRFPFPIITDFSKFHCLS